MLNRAVPKGRKLRVYADLHIHSKYSRATSSGMDVDEIAHYGAIKGLNLVGTGDFTHPKWLEELERKLVEIEDDGIYERAPGGGTVKFVISGEVNTVFEYEGRSRKIHNVILVPNFEVAGQLIDRLRRFGNLEADGRPTLALSAPELIEEALQVSREILVFPAHAWTPWFSLFGANSGFNSLEECYQDMAKDVYALETGLSSDPPMNWRLSELDRYALLSNSDSHSAWPWRLGREANVFELKELSYHELVAAIRAKDPERLKFTIEMYPQYGKYHWTGHRKCGISMPPKEAIAVNNVCPKCGRRMAKGVEQRVEELADREPNYKPPESMGYVHLLPLSEIIAAVLGVESSSSPKVWKIYNALIKRFGNEYNVALHASKEELSKEAGPEIAEAIIKIRGGKVTIQPGYDGKYGEIKFFEPRGEREPSLLNYI